MTIFDYLVLFVLGTSVLIGVLRGLVKELMSLASWVLAFVLANMFSADLAQMLPEAVPGQTLRVMLAFVALFIGVRLLCALAGMALDAVLKATGLTLADRGLGALFGFLRGCVFVLVAVMLCGMTEIPKQAFWQDALLRPTVESGARMVKPLLPPALAKHLHY